MKDRFMEEVEAMNKEMTQKYEEEAGQFNAKEREREIEEENASLISRNGGRNLDYFLMPKSYKKSGDSKEKHYRVPLVFGRLYPQAKTRGH